ncbi:MAG: flavodoxin [Clostridia bacterium]|nr:flavodoxin [Clostridia bacterium]
MSKIAVVYWSGTGNTEAMASAVAEGAKEKGAEAVLLTPSEFDSDMLDNFDAVAFGCPAMGAEELEESEFLPMFETCESKLKGKKIALFGSYGWGDGEWMRTWEENCTSDGALLACESVICNESPDDDAIASCKALGASLA